MNAIELLKRDHQILKNLFTQFDNADTVPEKKDILDRIRNELTSHLQIEENLFYPALSGLEAFRSALKESNRSNHEIRDLLSRMEESDATDEEAEIEMQMSDLREAAEQHFIHEESGFYSRLPSLMDHSKLEQLGMALEKARKKPSKAA